MRIFRIPHIMFRLFPKLIWKKSTTPNAIYLSFDDGPDSNFTPQVLNILQKYAAHASFFVLGNKALENPNLIHRIQKNHVIGIHSYDHRRLFFQSKAHLYDQLFKNKQTVENIIEKPVHFFRPPYGHFSPRLIKICTQLKLQIVMWSLMSYDFDIEVPSDFIIDLIQTKVKSGDILVFHDGHLNSHRTVRILEPIIKILKESGFELSSVDK